MCFNVYLFLFICVVIHRVCLVSFEYVRSTMETRISCLCVFILVLLL